MKFKSRFAELSFYVDGERHQFSNGQFSTEDVKVIEAVSKLVDVEVEEEAPTEEVATPKPKAKSSKK
jgi:hypothetical protein